jgi:hypothetical protein
MNEELYDWVFFVNPYEKMCYAVKREFTNEYYNGTLPEGSFHKNENMQTLINAINENNIINPLNHEQTK